MEFPNNFFFEFPVVRVRVLRRLRRTVGRRGTREDLLVGGRPKRQERELLLVENVVARPRAPLDETLRNTNQSHERGTSQQPNKINQANEPISSRLTIQQLLISSSADENSV